MDVHHLSLIGCLLYCHAYRCATLLALCHTCVTHSDLQDLSVLNLEGCYKVSSKTLEQRLGQLDPTTLRDLDLRGLKKLNAERLIPVIAVMANLESLRLHAVSNHVSTAVLSQLQNCTALVVLDLSLQSDGPGLDLVTHSCPKLRELCLSLDWAQEQQSIALSPHLVKLCLKNIGLVSDCFRDLSKCQHLVHVELRNVGLTDQLLELPECKFPCLTTLLIEEDDVSAEALIDFIERCPALNSVLLENALVTPLLFQKLATICELRLKDCVLSEFEVGDHLGI